jgi:Cyclic nucleotide-binding domain
MLLDRSMFNWFLGQYPHAILSFILTTTSRQWRVAYVTLVDILGIPGAFETSMESPEPAFPDVVTARDDIIAASHGMQTFDAGTALYEQGDVGDCVYVLLEGRATITVHKNGKIKTTRTVHPGHVAGGVASFVCIPHRGTVRD